MENLTLQKTISCINAKKSFIIEAGAGSGKTYTLIESLKHILNSQAKVLKKANQKIVCITYTNVAKDEISERIEYNSFVEVHTIHEFLWSVIRNFQNELKEEIIAYNAADTKKSIEGLEEKIRNVEITYSQYGRQFVEGKIFHDDVIDFSAKIFCKYPKISRITVSQYPYIFVDEYQDTEKSIVELLIDKLLEQNKGILTLGFFGDSMQKIYKEGIGVIDSDKLEKITKEENFRCSKAVIEVLNKIRTNIQQKPAGKNLDGEVFFIHCNERLSATDQNYQETLSYLKRSRGWKDDMQNLKILMLTHKGIASKLEYSGLIAAYDNDTFGRKRLYAKEERFSDFLFNKIEKICELYDQKSYGEFIQFIGKEQFRLISHSDKEKIQGLMNGLNALRSTGNIQDVLDYIYKKNIFIKPSKITEFEKRISSTDDDEQKEKDKTFYSSLMAVSYKEVISLNQYINDNTPYSTKHGVKGTEFNNVLVVIDDSLWKKEYNFNYLFTGHNNKSQFSKSLNLLYVCCSRAKDKLAVLSLSKIDRSGIQEVEKLFGKENVLDITNLTTLYDQSKIVL